MAMARKVFVYRNIRNNLYSVRDCKTGRVIKRMESLCLRDCEFRVGEAGRKRVLASGHKNVHAGVVGYLTKRSIETPFSFVSYNPKRGPTFYDLLTDLPVKKADIVFFLQNGILIYG